MWQLQVHADAPLQAQGRAAGACETLKRLLVDYPLAAGMPAAERCCPSSVALCALAGVHRVPLRLPVPFQCDSMSIGKAT